MKIKEMAQRSGVSAKTIRFYEEKGLLQSKRLENTYREFSETDLAQLQRIALLRKIGCPLSAIQSLLQGDLTLMDLLETRKQQMEQEATEQNIQFLILKDMLQELTKQEELNVVSWLETLQETESEEFQELQMEWDLMKHHSLAYYISTTLILSGPILMTFLWLEENHSMLWLSILLSLVSMVLLTLLWREYWIQRKTHQAIKKGGWFIFLGLIIAIMVGILLFVGITSLKERLLVSGNYMMWSVPALTELLPMIFLMEGFIVCGSILAKRTNNIDIAYLPDVLSWMKRHWRIVVTFNLIVLYFTFSQINIVYPDHLLISRWNAPIAQSYSLSDIKEVETGFASSMFSLDGSHRGDFYYIVKLKNGLSVDISQPTPSNEKRYEEHTYLENEEFDELLMKKGIPKKADVQYFSSNTLGEEYRQRFLRIAKNEPVSQ